MNYKITSTRMGEARVFHSNVRLDIITRTLEYDLKPKLISRFLLLQMYILSL